jgi:uncharacterized cofD-like protein
MEQLTRELSTGRLGLLPKAHVGPRVVCIGGGTGLPVVLRGLVRKVNPAASGSDDVLTAIVAMSDDGGSSGRLKRERGALPPGDVRNCLVALAKERGALAQAVQYRFNGKRGIAGHALGNLLLTALTELRGDFLEAVRLLGSLLRVQGNVLPSTLCPVELVAVMEDERRVTGERNIVRDPASVRRVQLRPFCPPPAAGVLEALARAELVTLGPGSLYSSVLPSLLVDGVADVLKASRGLKVLVQNLMTEPGETDGMGVREHVEAVLRHVGPLVDVVLINGTSPPEEAVERYGRKGARLVEPDSAAVRSLGVIPYVADLLRPGRRIRHDGAKLARVLLRLLENGA